MVEQNKNLWAPWRMEYIHSLGPDARDDGCFLCTYWQHPKDDVANRVLWRSDNVYVVMNRFPYTNGHLLIAPGAHVGDMTAMDDDLLAEMTRATRDAIRVLTDVASPQGFNVGINLGRCAGAGLPDHIHTHIVPRWNGDTNYMAVVGDVRVIPQSLDALHEQLVTAADNIGLTT